METKVIEHTSLAQVEGEPVQERVRNQLSEEEAEREDDHAGNGESLQNPHGIPHVLPNATRRAAAAVLPVRALLSDRLDRRRTEANVLGAGLKKPAGTGPVTAVTGLTGPDRFRYRAVRNRPKFKF